MSLSASGLGIKISKQGLRMLYWFLAAGLSGVLCGLIFRAPALIVLSFASFAGTFGATFLLGGAWAGSLLDAILTTAALQMGYLLGAGLFHIWRRMQPQLVSIFGSSVDVQALLRRREEQFPKHG